MACRWGSTSLRGSWTVHFHVQQRAPAESQVTESFVCAHTRRLDKHRDGPLRLPTSWMPSTTTLLGGLRKNGACPWWLRLDVSIPPLQYGLRRRTRRAGWFLAAGSRSRTSRPTKPSNWGTFSQRVEVKWCAVRESHFSSPGRTAAKQHGYKSCPRAHAADKRKITGLKAHSFGGARAGSHRFRMA